MVHTHTLIHTRTRTRIHTHTYTHTHIHAHAHQGLSWKNFRRKPHNCFWSLPQETLFGPRPLDFLACSGCFVGCYWSQELAREGDGGRGDVLSDSNKVPGISARCENHRCSLSEGAEPAESWDLQHLRKTGLACLDPSYVEADAPGLKPCPYSSLQPPINFVMRPR